MGSAWYEIENEPEVASPALLVYPERIAENIARMLRRVDSSDRLRPHVKTHKMKQVVRLQQEAGLERFKCSTIAEAEMLAQCGAKDVQIAYQLVGPNVGRMAELAAAFPQVRFSCLVDDPRAASELSSAVVGVGASIGLLVDLDVGLGRSGISAGEAAFELYRLLDDLEGVRPAGLHVYDGHIKDSDLEERRRRVEHDFAAVWTLRDQLLAAGLSVPEVVAGGSPTFSVHAENEDTTCSPGTCLFWDFGYASRFPDLDFLYAAVLLTRVISRPDGNRLCLDLGYKAIAADNPQPRAMFFGLPDAKAVVHNEEHLTIETSRAQDYDLGSVLYAVPYHICPTTALHREVFVVENGRVHGTWQVAARDRRLSI